MHHLDVRQSGNGILITSPPAEVDGVPAAWPLRLRNDDNGQGLVELGAALAAGRPHGISVEKGTGFEPPWCSSPTIPKRASGRSPGYAPPKPRTSTSSSSGARNGRWSCGAEAGENVRRIVPLLGPDAPPADEPEDCQLCPGCYRPVYESSTSHSLIGAGPMPVIGLCRLCTEGTTLRSLRQADVPIDPQQRTVLETVAAAMA